MTMSLNGILLSPLEGLWGLGDRWHHGGLVEEYARLRVHYRVTDLVLVMKDGHTDGHTFDLVAAPGEESELWEARCLPMIPHISVSSAEIKKIMDCNSAYAEGHLAS